MYARVPPIVKLPHLFYSAKTLWLPGLEAENSEEKTYQGNKMTGLIVKSKLAPQNCIKCIQVKNINVLRQLFLTKEKVLYADSLNHEQLFSSFK